MKTNPHIIKTTVRFLILAIFLTCSIIRAQDKITLKNGDELNAKVMEINDREVKFKMKGEENGPTRILSLNDIFSIVYSSGKKEMFNSNTVQESPKYDPKPVQKTSTSTSKNWDGYDPDTSDFAKKKRKNFSGPRVGFTYITDGTTSDYLLSQGKRPSTVQFGWQFEGRLFTIEDGTSGLIEFIPMIGGVDQGLFLPSANFLLGLRGGSDRSWEFAIGPHFGLKADYKQDIVGSIGVVLGFGTSFKKGNVWFPVNLALVPSVGEIHSVTKIDPATGNPVMDATGNPVQENQKFQTGWRISLVVGFNSRRK